MNAEGLLGYLVEFVYYWCMTAFLSLKVLLRNGFDVVHACNPPETYYLLAKFYKLCGKKFVFDHHDLSPEMYLAKYSEKKGGLVYRILLFLNAKP